MDYINSEHAKIALHLGFLGYGYILDLCYFNNLLSWSKYNGIVTQCHSLKQLLIIVLWAESDFK